MLVVVYCLLSCLTWLCSKILLSLYLENSSPWSWEREECSSTHGEGQRNTATQRAAEGQVQRYCLAWTAGRENKGKWKAGTAVEVLVRRDRCIEKTAVCCNYKTCWTWGQSQHTAVVTGTHHLNPDFFSSWYSL